MSDAVAPTGVPAPPPGKACHACGGALAPGARYCGHCGAPQSNVPMVAPQPPGRAGHEVFCRACGRPINAAAPLCPGCGAPQTARAAEGEKSRVTAGVLAIMLGGIGIHKFYLGRPIQGILYLLFCWTFIPAIISLIEGTIYLCSSDAGFARKYG